MDPFYTLEDISGLDYLKNYHSLLSAQSTDTDRPGNWHYMERVHDGNDKKINQLAREALKMGADGIHFIFPERKTINYNSLLQGISPHATPLRFQTIKYPGSLLEAYINYLNNDSGIHLKEIKGGIDFDPVMNYSLSGTLDERGFESLVQCIRLTKELPHLKVLTIHGDHFHNAGCDAAHEIAYSLNAVVDYLDRLTDQGISLEEILPNVRISLAVGTNYFMEIAKLKVVRILYRYILNTYGIGPSPFYDPWIHCDTSFWTKTLYDPQVNLLRNTTEAMAAVLGGANSISILPFDTVFNRYNDFSQRISRNISNLLKEEVSLDKVIDPMAGSYYMEVLIDKLAGRSLEIFKETEANGGYLNAFKQGKIQQKIASIRDQKYDLYTRRKRVMVGNNRYMNPDERINPEEITWKNQDLSLSNERLVPVRASYHFDRLRLNTELYVGKKGEASRPRVFISLIGNDRVIRNSRSIFARDFFSCAGFSVRESSPSSSLFKSIQKAIESQAEIIVMCGSDEDYVQSGADYARAFKANQRGLLVVAGNPDEARNALLSAGVDEFIYPELDLIRSLHQFQINMKIIKA
jgi:methylmalonyl-CoA mutase